MEGKCPFSKIRSYIVHTCLLGILHIFNDRWKFDPNNPIAHAAWNAFYHHLESKLQNSGAWHPYVVEGKKEDKYVQNYNLY